MKRLSHGVRKVVWTKTFDFVVKCCCAGKCSPAGCMPAPHGAYLISFFLFFSLSLYLSLSLARARSLSLSLSFSLSVSLSLFLSLCLSVCLCLSLSLSLYLSVTLQPVATLHDATLQASGDTSSLFFITLQPRAEWYTKSVSLKYEPASEPLASSTTRTRTELPETWTGYGYDHRVRPPCGRR